MTEDDAALARDYEAFCQRLEKSVNETVVGFCPDPDSASALEIFNFTAGVAPVLAAIMVGHIAIAKRPEITLRDAAIRTIDAVIEANQVELAALESKREGPVGHG